MKLELKMVMDKIRTLTMGKNKEIVVSDYSDSVAITRLCESGSHCSYVSVHLYSKKCSSSSMGLRASSAVWNR